MAKRGRSKKPNTTKPAPGSTRELLGLRVRALRLERAMTQRQLSDASGVSSVFLGVIERGEKSVGCDTLERVATAMGVPMLELFRFGGSEPSAPNKPSMADEVTLRISALARGASADSLTRLERIAEIVLAPEGSKAHRRPRGGVRATGMKRRSRDSRAE